MSCIRVFSQSASVVFKMAGIAPLYYANLDNIVPKMPIVPRGKVVYFHH